jgi:transposase
VDLPSENGNDTLLLKNIQQRWEEGAIPQAILPLIPDGATEINDIVSVFQDEDYWTYFLGITPVYRHHGCNQRLFRLTAAMLIDSGACRSIQIQKTFGVSKSSLDRAVRTYRKEGIDGFIVSQRVRRSGTVMRPEILEKGQHLLDEGLLRKEVANELGVAYDTLRKAIQDGRLKETELRHGTDKSSRSVADAQAAEGMGTACVRVGERMLAAVGNLPEGASTQFRHCRDVPLGGVLCALPALLENGLNQGIETMRQRVKGYYSAFHIIVLIAIMALCRIKTTEKLRGKAPGELGNLLGLDRIPEVRCLRQKMDELSADGLAEQWAAQLGRTWMEADPEAVGTLYVDGHTRVYHGSKTKLPRKYVCRERLCLRGTTDYWVNDAVGRPFFFVDKVVDPGLLQVLRNEIVPRLLQEVPHQPSEEALAQDPWLCRFVIVFDREGYSPGFFRDMWERHRISCMTYHKHPGKAWSEEWFTEQEITMPGGELVNMKLAEAGSLVGSGKDAMWMREIRRIRKSGHQTSLISTAFGLPGPQLAARMFSRWCQENFFRYMMQHFEMDLLTEYGTMPLADAEQVVNPTWRECNRQKRSIQGKLTYLQASFAQLTLNPQPEHEPRRHQKWEHQKAELLATVEDHAAQLEKIKQELKSTPKHVPWSELEDGEKFHKLAPNRKRFMDTIRMIAYRAETAMARLLIGEHVDLPAARRILQDLFLTEADIVPVNQNQLQIIVHRSARPKVDQHLRTLFAHLNDAQFEYPGTNLVMLFKLAAKSENSLQLHPGVTTASQR